MTQHEKKQAQSQSSTMSSSMSQLPSQAMEQPPSSSSSMAQPGQSLANIKISDKGKEKEKDR